MKAHPDINDTLRVEGSDAVRARHDRAQKYKSKANGSAGPPRAKATAKVAGAHSMEALKTMTFEPIKYVVPGVIVEGLTILAGKPKLGKSWLMLHAAFAVASGGFTLGDIPCEEGDVLYCALEDNQRRLQSRMTKLAGISRPWPKRMKYHYFGEVPRLNEGGLDLIRQWIKSVKHPRLIVIDTFVAVRAPKKNGQPAYDADYESAKELQWLANQYGIAVVIVHHQRKMDADDVFDTISGTLGLTGVVDTILVLKRETSGGIILHGRGRDLAEIEKAVAFNKDACTWTIIGSATEARASVERKAILSALRDIGEPATPTEIATAADLKLASVKHLVLKMVKGGLLKKTEYGKYMPVDMARVNGEAAE